MLSVKPASNRPCYWQYKEHFLELFQDVGPIGLAYTKSMTSRQSAKEKFDYTAIKRTLGAASTADLHQVIVNTPFDYPLQTAMLFLGIVVLLFVDEESGMIHRIALSNTELAKNTTDVSVLPFEEIKIPLSDPENIIAQTIRTGEPHDTTDWRYLFTPALSAEAARINQASGGIAYSAVYPLQSSQAKGAMIFSYFEYAHNIGEQQREFMEHYTTLVTDRLHQA